MKKYIFVGPGAPQTNIKITANSLKKAVAKFEKRKANCTNYKIVAHYNKEVFVFYAQLPH